MSDVHQERPLAAIVLAAGQGKRMGADVPKVLIEACGRSLVEHVLEALAPIGAHPTAVVYGHGGEMVRTALASRDLQFAHQPTQLGTGHAVQCGLTGLGTFEGDVLVLCGDTPLLSTSVLEDLVAEHRATGNALTVLSAEMDQPGSLGRIVRASDGTLESICEAADATDAQRAIREINTGVMVIRGDVLVSALKRIQPNNAQGELYLTDVPALLLADGLGVGAHICGDPLSALGVNRPAELLIAIRALRERTLDYFATNGVRIEDPGSTVIDAGAEIDPGTLLRPFTTIAAGARIGADCSIGPFVTIGPGTTLGDDVRVDAHVELRGTTVEAQARIPGPARLVGAVIGAGCWVGPGVVTEGSAEGRVVIGDGARVGAGAILVAPLTVGAGARIAEGTVVTRDVSPDSGTAG